MSERRSVEPREGVAYPVSLGASLSRVGDGDGDDAYVALRYDARVPGIDPTKPGRVRLDENGKRVRVEFQNVVDGERAINYQGVYVENKDDPREAGVECALIFDPDSGSYTIERLGGTVKGLRVTRDAAGDDAGVGMGVNEDVTTRAAAAAAARNDPPRTHARRRSWRRRRRRWRAILSSAPSDPSRRIPPPRNHPPAGPSTDSSPTTTTTVHLPPRTRTSRDPPSSTETRDGTRRRFVARRRETV